AGPMPSPRALGQRIGQNVVGTAPGRAHRAAHRHRSSRCRHARLKGSRYAGRHARLKGSRYQRHIAHRVARGFQPSVACQLRGFAALGALPVRRATRMPGLRITPTRSEKSPLDRALSLFTAVRAGEGATAVLMLINIFVLLVCYSVIKTVREPLILLGGGAEVRSYTAAGQALLLMGF